MKRQWYRIQNAAEEPSVAELYIFSDIGKSWWDDDAVSAKQFIDDLKALPQAVTRIVVRVNSFGGSVFDAVAIANALRDQASKGRTVETTIEGIAASAASIVIMAGSVIRIGDNAMVMIHDPLTCACGDAKEFRKIADDLDAVRGSIIATYRWHSTLSDEELVALMDADTWMDADQAIANGFATEKVEGLKAAAVLDSRVLATINVPETFRARVDALVKRDAPAGQATAAAPAEVLRLCREASCLEEAEALVAAGAPLADVQARITAATHVKRQLQARADEIRGICATAKLQDLAAGYIAGGMPVDQVRAHLTTITALLDKAEIDTGLDPDQGARSRARIDTAAVYAQLNRTTH